MAIGSEFWVEGNQGEVCILVDIYDFKIIAYASSEEITPDRMKAVLKEKYPDVVVFEIMTDITPGKTHAMGKRQL